jgi:hypothetical protein
MALTDADIERIADRVAEKLRAEFSILSATPAMLRPRDRLVAANVTRDPSREEDSPRPTPARPEVSE